MQKSILFPPPTFTFTFYSCGWLRSKTVSKILCTLGQWNLCQKRRGKKRSVRAQIIFHSIDLSIHVCIYAFLTESARKECSKKILLTLLKKYLLYCPKLVIIISWKWQVLLESMSFGKEIIEQYENTSVHMRCIIGKLFIRRKCTNITAAYV